MPVFLLKEAFLFKNHFAYNVITRREVSPWSF
ncbi:hypothetical protein CHY_1199 [Carboxydothermus hydrogenoformans Z-2901]|uniref:Uncharacterized protein n=1 Tax=Carboxydothermus hydrogenoformans (strain ATCC BAA-161 / DSM 6008 / Z-2901) TaxID=246194 RepID=Q3ACU1_CARHZ|nr:hypothetical protein CHY_1199 [Carboxydothermus hydrogenoformans Z-2901]